MSIRSGHRPASLDSGPGKRHRLDQRPLHVADHFRQDQVKLFGIRLTADAGIAGDLISKEGREGRNGYRRLT